MKAHEINFDFLSNSLLFGINVSHLEIRNDETMLFHPVFEIKLGFIFFNVSYRNTDLTIGRE